MDTVTITRGFREDERERVGSLYWEAFGSKMRRAFPDETTGETVVAASLRGDHLLVARRDGLVLGVCGFHADGTGAVDVTWDGLRRHLTLPAALRAVLVLSPMARPGRPGALVLDGICVAADARGLGVGTALLDAAARHAREVGAQAVRLSVVDGNPRARALYVRRGFSPVGRSTLGPFGAVYGITGYTTMERPVA